MIASKGMAGARRIYCSFINNINFYEHNSTRSCFNIGIDRLLDMVRVNVIGNALSTVVIAKWETSMIKRKVKTT